MASIALLPPCALLFAALIGGCTTQTLNSMPTSDGGTSGGAGTSGNAGHGPGGETAGRDGAGGMAGGGSPGTDSGADGTPDPAACDCRVEDATLFLSLACFCAEWGSSWGCPDPQRRCTPGTNMSPTAYPVCGLMTETQQTFAGPFLWVWDASGKLVGRQIASDTSMWFGCPSDPSLVARRVRAGRFPDPSCEADACSCVVAGEACVVPAADAGVLDGGL